jgi:hypothetical protein
MNQSVDELRQTRQLVVCKRLPFRAIDSVHVRLGTPPEQTALGFVVQPKFEEDRRY